MGSVVLEQGGWTRSLTVVPSNLTHSGILWILRKEPGTVTQLNCCKSTHNSSSWQVCFFLFYVLASPLLFNLHCISPSCADAVWLITSRYRDSGKHFRTGIYCLTNPKRTRTDSRDSQLYSFIYVFFLPKPNSHLAGYVYEHPSRELFFSFH